MSSEAFDYEGYREKQIEIGLEFQDFVQDVFHKDLGLSVGNYQSRRYQFEKGENRAGVEIKRDSKFRQSGNLYIELAEKARPRNGAYAPSGINREDNSWLYVIGDESAVYVFAKSQLVRLAKCGKYPKVENKFKTSVGMLLPVKDAETLAAKVITFTKGDNGNGVTGK